MASGTCSGTFTDLVGQRAMAYYQDTGANGPELNYYYYMASQFALSDRWFSPVASKSTPNRIATYSGGTTEGLVRDPFVDDQYFLPDQNMTPQPQIKALTSKTIFQELDEAKVSWKIYYSEKKNGCPADGSPCTTPGNPAPDTTFTAFAYSGKYLYRLGPTSPTCIGTTQPDPTNTFCIDPNKIAPISQYFTDVAAGTLPSFAYIEAEYGFTDEHPGSGQSILNGQQQAAKLINALITSPSWLSSAFFLAYDEGGGPYDHVPPVPGHSNDLTTAAVRSLYPDIGSIAVDADAFKPCQPPPSPDPTRLNMWTPTQHCDLKPDLAGNPAGVIEPGDTPTDAATISGFKAQLGFRVPNMIISPYARKHYVGHTPMDHTAVLRFVESRFLNGGTHLTPRVSAQPDLLDFFDFTNQPWLVPPTNIPTPTIDQSTCHSDVLQ
jgi:phospholipase C